MKKCKICGSEDIQEIEYGGTDYCRCPSCRTMYLKKIPDSNTLLGFYGREYKITSEDFSETEYRRIFRLPEQIQLIKEISDFRKPPAKLIDIGCDKGYFLDEARRAGFSVSGVEPSMSARKYCEIIKIDCFKTAEEVKEKQDIAVMWHSLEHHRNPPFSLNEINELLNPGGMIFIRVPDFESLYSKIFGKSWIWFQGDRHYYHFSKKSIKILLENAGFELLKIESRKPNTLLTKRMNRIALKIFKKEYAYKLPQRKKIARLYEDITGVEIFAAGKKR